MGRDAFKMIEYYVKAPVKEVFHIPLPEEIEGRKDIAEEKKEALLEKKEAVSEETKEETKEKFSPKAKGDIKQEDNQDNFLKMN